MSEFAELKRQLQEALSADDTGGGYSDKSVLLANLGEEAGTALRRGQITEAEYKVLMAREGGPGQNDGRSTLHA